MDQCGTWTAPTGLTLRPSSGGALLSRHQPRRQTVYTALPAAAYDVASGELLWRRDVWSVFNLDLIADGSLLALNKADHVAPYEVLLLHTATGRTRAVLRGQHDTVRDLRFSNSGDVLAAGTRYGEVLLFDVPSGGVVGPVARRRDRVERRLQPRRQLRPRRRHLGHAADLGPGGHVHLPRADRFGRAAPPVLSSPTCRPTGVGSPTGGRTRPATGGCGSWTWARARSRLARGCRSRRVSGWPPRGAGTAGRTPRTMAASAATVIYSSVVSLVDSLSGRVLRSRSVVEAPPFFAMTYAADGASLLAADYSGQMRPVDATDLQPAKRTIGDGVDCCLSVIAGTSLAFYLHWSDDCAIDRSRLVDLDRDGRSGGRRRPDLPWQRRRGVPARCHGRGDRAVRRALPGSTWRPATRCAGPPATPST